MLNLLRTYRVLIQQEELIVWCLVVCSLIKINSHAVPASRSKVKLGNQLQPQPPPTLPPLAPCAPSR